MGYDTPLRAVHRKIAPNVVLSSCPFSILGKVHIGARMALFKYGDKIVIWSPLPYGEAVIEGLQLLTGTKDTRFNISHIFVINLEHNLCARTFKKEYPDVKVFAPAGTLLGEGVALDYAFDKQYANQVFDASLFNEAFGVTEPAIVDNLEVIYLSYHQNRDIALYEKASKTLFLGDVIFNVGVPGSVSGDVKLEQYSEEVGMPRDYIPSTGWSFLGRYLQPNSAVGSFIVNRINVTKKEEARDGLRLIYKSWNFERLVPVHGNTIEEDPKEAFRAPFSHFIAKI